MCQQKSSLILKCFWFQRRLLSRGVWGDKNSYDIGVFGFLLIKSWSVERDGKRFIEILEEPQNDGNVSVSSVQKCCISYHRDFSGNLSDKILKFGFTTGKLL